MRAVNRQRVSSGDGRLPRASQRAGEGRSGPSGASRGHRPDLRHAARVEPRVGRLGERRRGFAMTNQIEPDLRSRMA
jgi:hypothetical protein